MIISHQLFTGLTALHYSDKWNAVSDSFQACDGSGAYGSSTRSTARLEAERRSAMDQVLVAIRAVSDLEAKLQLLEPWTEGHPEYEATLEYIRERNYHRALDNIQRLVIQRLFEVSRANLSGMGAHLLLIRQSLNLYLLCLSGYKLRTSIWKVLKSRSKAVNSALIKYNKLAALMSPPAPLLEWKQLMEYSFVSEFELLCNSRSHRNITDQPWTIPAHREMTTKYFKILRAREEIKRVNIEMRRLWTSIRDVHIMYERHIRRLKDTDPLLALEIQACYDWRARVDWAHALRLNDIKALAGFTGVRGPGTRCGAMAVDPEDTDDNTPATRRNMADRANISAAERTNESMPVDDGGVDEDDGEDEEFAEQAIGLSEAIGMEPSTGGVPNSMLFNWSLA